MRSKLSLTRAAEGDRRVHAANLAPRPRSPRASAAHLPQVIGRSAYRGCFRQRWAAGERVGGGMFVALVRSAGECGQPDGRKITMPMAVVEMGFKVSASRAEALFVTKRKGKTVRTNRQCDRYVFPGSLPFISQLSCPAECYYCTPVGRLVRRAGLCIPAAERCSPRVLAPSAQPTDVPGSCSSLR